MKWCELTGIIWLELLFNSMLVSQNVFWGLIIIAIFFELLIMTMYIHKQLVHISLWRLWWFNLISLILLIPFGGMGISGYLFANVPFPESIIRLINLHRVSVGIPVGILYLILLIIWIKATKVHDNNETTSNQKRNSWLLIIVCACVGLLVMELLTDINIISDRVSGILALLIGFLLVSSIFSTLIYFHFRMEILSKDVKFYYGGWLIVIAGIATITFGTFGIKTETAQAPIVIAHRGVDSSNGIQNSIQSLKKTGLKNKYIEMDIQISRDDQFVLMHDPNLKKLAGKDQTIETDEFANLKKVKLYENGYVTLLSSFDEYFKQAEHQKNQLMIELKPQHIAPNIVAQKFNQQYGLRVINSDAVVHSVDSEIIATLHKINPKLKTGLIRPFVITKLPTQEISFYSLDYRTVNQTIINKAHRNNKKVYVWTVNNPVAAKRMMALGVDGIITDNSSLINKVIRQQPNSITEQAKNIIWQLI